MVVHYDSWNFWFPIHEPSSCLPNPIAQFEDVGWLESLVSRQLTSIGANLSIQLPPINSSATSLLQKPFQLWLILKCWRCSPPFEQSPLNEEGGPPMTSMKMHPKER
jgi:hypothetical protein